MKPLAVIAALMLLLSCSSTKSSTEPTGPSDIAGRITLITPGGRYGGVIRVETNPAEASGSPKAIATVNNATVLFLNDGNEGDFRQLAVDQWVRVWFSGVVRESYPVQGTAGTIAIDSLSIGVAAATTPSR